MVAGDEFDRIASRNLDLEECDWRKVTAFNYDGLSALMAWESYLGWIEWVRRGLLNTRMTVAQVVAGIERLDWPVQVHVVFFGGEAFREHVGAHLSPGEYPVMAARFAALQDYLVTVHDRKPPPAEVNVCL